MAVPAGPTEKRYIGNGVTTIFTIPFLLLSASDLDVFINGVEVVSGFTITDVENPASTITFTVAPPNLSEILLALNVPFERLNDYQENGDFLAKTVNRDFDRIWQALKQLLRLSTRSLVLGFFDVDGAGAYRAKGNRIADLGDPVAQQDAVNVRSMKSFVEGALAIVSGGLGWFIQEGSLIQRTFQDKLRESLSLADFGLLGDGSDETVKMQQAVTAAGIQRKRLVGDKSKTYKVTSTIIGGSNCRLQDVCFDSSSLTGTKHALVFQGALGATSAFTSDVEANSFTIQVADGSIFSPDEWVLITTDTSYYPYSAYNVGRGEWVQVRSVTGNSIGVTNPIVQPYTVATGARLRKCSFVENVVLDGVLVVGSGTAGGNERGISLRFTKNCTVRNCDVLNIDQYALEVSCSIFFAIHHNFFRGVFYNGVNGSIFYAIVLLDACQHFVVHDNQGSRSRHLAVTTAASAGQGRWGQCMFGIIHDNSANDCMAGGGGRSYAYEMHGTGQHLLWSNNIATGCYAFMRIEGGSDSQVIGGGCNGYAFQGLIIGGSGNTIRNIDVSGVRLDNYTGEVASGSAVRFEVTTLMENVRLNGVTANKVSVANIGSAVSVGTSTVMRNCLIKGLRAAAGDAESTGSAVAFAAGVSGGLSFEDCDFFGWRTGYNFGSASKISAKGGSVENFSAAATGWAFYSSGDRNIFKGVRVRNINTVARLDAASTNNLVVENTFTDCVISAPSNAGAGNTVAPNYTV